MGPLGNGMPAPLDVGVLYGGDMQNQQRVAKVVGNPQTGEGYGGPLYDAWGRDDAHIQEMQRQHNAYLRGRTAVGMVAPQAQGAEVARAPVNTGMVSTPAAANPSVWGWAQQLAGDIFPSPSAGAAMPRAPQADLTQQSGRLLNYTPKPQPPIDWMQVIKNAPVALGLVPDPNKPKGIVYQGSGRG